MVTLKNFLIFIEHVVSIIAHLLKFCRGSARSRLVLKFTEGDHEKVDRLMEVRVETIFKIMDCPLNLFINISF